MTSRAARSLLPSSRIRCTSSPRPRRAARRRRRTPPRGRDAPPSKPFESAAASKRAPLRSSSKKWVMKMRSASGKRSIRIVEPVGAQSTTQTSNAAGRLDFPHGTQRHQLLDARKGDQLLRHERVGLSAEQLAQPALHTGPGPIELRLRADLPRPNARPPRAASPRRSGCAERVGEAVRRVGREDADAMAVARRRRRPWPAPSSSSRRPPCPCATAPSSRGPVPRRSEAHDELADPRSRRAPRRAARSPLGRVDAAAADPRGRRSARRATRATSRSARSRSPRSGLAVIRPAASRSNRRPESPTEQRRRRIVDSPKSAAPCSANACDAAYFVRLERGDREQRHRRRSAPRLRFSRSSLHASPAPGRRVLASARPRASRGSSRPRRRRARRARGR